MDYNPAGARAYGEHAHARRDHPGDAGARSIAFSARRSPRSSRPLDLGVALVLLATYVCYLVYMIWTHPELFAARETERARHPR